MERTYHPLIRTLLAVALAFAVVSSVDAEAVLRRGDDQTGKSDRTEASRRSESRTKERSRSYRPAETTRPANPNVSQDRSRRVPDATSTYRPQDRRYRPDDRRTYDYRYRRDDGKFNRVEEKDRYRHNYPKTYRPPRYYRGHYYYYDTPFFYDRPLRYGHWVFSYIPNYSYRSAYYYYGYFPYIPVARVIIVRRPVIAYVERPIVIKETHRYDEGYYLDGPRSSFDAALFDIRAAWLRDDPELLLRHVRKDVRIDVLLDGDYSYSTSGEDYREMTLDAIAGTKTIDFELDSIRSRGNDRVIAYGRHTFISRNGARNTVYVSCLLERIEGDWVITEVGSSPKRLDR